MTTDVFAPMKRAAMFFGAMGVVVASLTIGAAVKPIEGTSSVAVAQAKQRMNLPSEREIEIARRELPRPVPASAGASMQAGLGGGAVRLR
jgi:hypothetical protein